MTRRNLTFRGSPPTWANACVGHNGNPSYVEYARGFSKAANILAKAVLKNNSIQLTADEFVYPICFNMRHSIELRLKGAIKSLQKLATLKSERMEFRLHSTHDLNILWSFFKSESQRIDNRFQKIISELDYTITDIAEVDPTGQTFRYPLSTTSVKHLTDVSLINLAVVLRSFIQLEKGLDELLRLYEWLIEEYRLSGLKKIQRNIIFLVAHDLPNRTQWTNNDFNDIKTALRDKFSLSSNQLSKILTYIQNNHSLSHLIGMEKPLLGVPTEQIESFVRAWMTDNPEIKKILSSASNDDQTQSSWTANLAELLSRPRVDSKVLEVFATAESTAGLHALFYYAYDLRFSEHYEQLYQHYLNEMTAIAKRNSDELHRELRHVFNKSNFLHHLIQSLYALGHFPLAEKIIAEHEIEHIFDWLTQARNGELFKYPEFAQYPRPI